MAATADRLTRQVADSLATEVVAALIEWAGGQGVNRFRATIGKARTTG